jgi:PleD family two-component response regulator
MNILVLETDTSELAVIQQAVNGTANTVVPVVSSAQAWQAIQTGDVQFLLANWDTTDLVQAQLIQRIRALQSPHQIYILIISSTNFENESAAGVDDVLRRSYTTVELKNRIAIAERIISLTAKLAVAQELIEEQAAFDALTGFINRSRILAPISRGVGTVTPRLAADEFDRAGY